MYERYLNLGPGKYILLPFFVFIGFVTLVMGISAYKLNLFLIVAFGIAAFIALAPSLIPGFLPSWTGYASTSKALM